MYENWKYTKGANEEYIKKVLSDCCDETKICTVLIAFMDGNLKLTDLSYIFEYKTCRRESYGRIGKITIIYYWLKFS